MKFIATFILCALLLLPWLSHAEPQLIPRTIITFYDSTTLEDLRYSPPHLYAEMPLNHLGLVLEYHDINAPLPDIKHRDDVRGVLTWFVNHEVISDPITYLQWANGVLDIGKKFVVIEAPGFYVGKQGKEISTALINSFFNRMSLKHSNQWIGITYDVDIAQLDKEIYEFESMLPAILPPYDIMLPMDENVSSYLIARHHNTPYSESHLAVTTPQGGYIASGYAISSIFNKKKDDYHRQWYINPFLFFQRAFSTEDLPVPDTTTLAGQRIYYSHIDGDGWNNIATSEGYQGTMVLSSQVILNHILQAYPDFPVTIGPIAAEIDEEWVGTAKSKQVAQNIFALPHIEVASHTYSHPYEWLFFSDYTPEKEEPYLHQYPHKTWAFLKTKKKVQSFPDFPRAYATNRFDLKKEIIGSIETINALAPKNKSVKIFLWSGNTTPFSTAINMTREANLRNINGGDSRLDHEFPSYLYVSPIGRQVENQQQIYASNSNENTYTDDWTQRFYNFRNLLETVENTETPRRIKPFNVYYHMYTGEKEASLNALKTILDYARERELTRITTSHFACIADGFYSTRIIRKDDNTWQISNSECLQTIRFDKHSFTGVDYKNSRGVIGHSYLHGNLYVFLDAETEQSLIRLQSYPNFEAFFSTDVAHLIKSSWDVRAFTHDNQQLNFTSQGFGPGHFQWRMPDTGRYQISVSLPEGKTQQYTAVTDAYNRLQFTVDQSAIEPVTINVIYEGADVV